MTARGKNNWDTMKEDYNNYQYDDDCGGIQYDHSRLYILNIPKGLSEEGLRTAFAKYGTLVQVHISKDPTKKYALVKYETPGEAKLAMTKLNNTEPMKLHISIARKKATKKENNYSRESFDRNHTNGPTNQSFREDNASISSKKSSRINEELINGDDMEETLPSLDDNTDPEIKIKGIQLELQRLQVQEQTVLLRQQLFQLEAARKKNLSQSSTSNRCILPDGRIMVRNVNDRNLEPRDLEGSFAAGAGDSLTLPGLQRGCACVVCGARADSFCARCGLTPYCSARCQRRDWAERHRACCHNLARMAGKVDTGTDQMVAEKETAPQVAPLRRPHSPAKPARRDDDSVPDLPGPKKPTQNNNNNKSPRNFNNNNSFYNKNRQQGDKRQQLQDSQKEHEDWGNKTATPAAPATPPAAAPVPKPQQVSKPAETLDVSQPKSVEPEKPAVPKVVPKAPGSLTDAMPAKGGKKIVPKNYLIELLSPGETVLLSVEGLGAECRSPSGGFVCLSMHERYQTEYQDLCEQFTVDMDKDTVQVKPAPGETFSYLNPSDEGWYRARCLTDTCAALVDAGRLAPVGAADRLRALPAQYKAAPEYCCLLDAAGVKVGDNLTCKLISKTSNGYKVSLSHVESGAPAGEGEVSRWMPTVEYPAPPAAAPAVIPEVTRPDVADKSKVLLVDATAADRAFVRPSDAASQRRFDQILEEVVLHARTATPLKEPPTKGQVVIGKFTDGLFYRALVKRTNVKQNKYLLEYIEFGNIEITPLENIYACPEAMQLSARPTEASQVHIKCTSPNALTQPAVEYLDSLKDELEELVLTIPSGEKSAPSGCTVVLTSVKANENVNRKLERMCTPEWKKMEEKGTDVVELEPIMFSELESLDIPADCTQLEVTDISALTEGCVSACPSGMSQDVLTRLTEQMAEYCNSDLGKEPYLPKREELCIAQFPPYPQWFRAVLLEQTPGSSQARVLYIDYGNVAEVSVTYLRKMLPEFVRGRPALASLLEIKDFPPNPTQEMLARAVEYMNINEEGRGVLAVARCVKQECGLYVAHAPGLVAAMAE